MKKSGVVALCLLLGLTQAYRGFSSGFAPDSPRSIVNTGHKGAVLGLEYDEKRNWLFSAGEDGTVRIWDAASGTLVRRLQVTHLSAGMLAVNPSRPQVAVVVTDGMRSFSIAVWDWEEERQLFRLPLHQEPLFLRYSGMGSWIVYGESTWASVHIASSDDGESVPFRPEGFGIVGFAEVSRSEKTIMTYQVAGRISYWDLATGDLVKDLPAVPYLSDVRLSRDRRYIVGLGGGEIVLVDSLTGATRALAHQPGIDSVDLSPDGKELAGVSAAEQGVLHRWILSGDAIVPRTDQPLPAEAPFVLRYGNDSLFLAGSSGAISVLTRAGQPQPFSRDELAEVSDFAATEGLIGLGSAGWIRIFTSDLLSGARPPSFVRSTILGNPFQAPVGLVFLSEAKLLVWRRDDVASPLAILDIPSGSFSYVQPGFQAPLVALEVTGDGLLGTEKGGFVRLVDLATGSARFESWLPGIRTIVSTSSTELVGGGNQGSAPGGSLLRIDTRTGETVALPGRNVFTYELLFDFGTRRLYSVGVDADGATHLLCNDGKGLERETLLDSMPEEDLDVSLAMDRSTGLLYSSLGENAIGVWDGRRLSRLPALNAIPRKLLARGGLLYSLNKDSTVRICVGGTGELVAELSLFADGEWCVLVAGGWYAASPGGDIRVRVFVDGDLVKAREDYRLRMQGL